MSIDEDIALDVADLPTDVFDVDGPERNDPSDRTSDRASSDKGWDAERRKTTCRGRVREGTPSPAVAHGIDDDPSLPSAPVSHPLLDGSGPSSEPSRPTTHR